MKKRFSETESYQRFITFVGGLSKQMALTELAHLLPPKLRTKGRFMGISRVASWASSILKIYDAETPSNMNRDIFQKFKNIFGPLKTLQWTVNKMNDDFNAINLVLEKVKKFGLTQKTLEASIVVLETLGPRSQIKEKMIAYLEETFNDVASLKTNTIVSSDIIESLFGKLKYLLQSGAQDIGRLALLLPCLCGQKITLNEVSTAMAEIQLKDLKTWEDEEAQKSLLAKRVQTFGEGKTDLKVCSDEHLTGLDGYLASKCVN